MDAPLTLPAAPLPPRPRPHEELLAVVERDRLLLASSALLDLVGYSRGEVASPEFRAHFLAHPSSPREAFEGEDGGMHELALAPPRAPALRCAAFALPLQWGIGRRARAILVLRDDERDPDALTDRTLRALAESLRAETADALRRLRRIDDALAAIVLAHPETLRAAAPPLVDARGGYLTMDDALRTLERSVRDPTPFRRPYQD